MKTYLIKQGNTYHVKVPIPGDVQHLFGGKRAFKKTLKTGDPDKARTRSGPLVEHYKNLINTARETPESLDELEIDEMKAAIRQARDDPNAKSRLFDALELNLEAYLLARRGVHDIEQLPEDTQDEVVREYKVASGALTPFSDPLEAYLRSRQVEEKTVAKDAHAIEKFAKHVGMIEETTKQTVKSFVAMLSEKEGLKARTIKDNLSTLRTYWRWLVEEDIAPDDRQNPFSVISAPTVRRKEAAEKTRLPFTISDIQTLHEAIQAGRSEPMNTIFKLAIYTGCRLEELASLETANTTPDSIQIVQAKTSTGNRTIPIHDALRPLLDELRANGQRFLIQGLSKNRYDKRGNSASKQFGKVKDKLGYDERYVFHSIRMTVATQLEQSGVPEGVTADILGHNKPTMSYGLYSGGTSMEQKYEAIMKLDYNLQDI